MTKQIFNCYVFYLLQKILATILIKLSRDFTITNTIKVVVLFTKFFKVKYPQSSNRMVSACTT